MEKLIEKADFFHDDEDKYDTFREKIEDWYNENEEKITAADVTRALNALNKKLTQQKCPVYESKGWEAAKECFETLIGQSYSQLISDNKISPKDVRQQYLNLYIEWFNYGPATIQLQLMLDSFNHRDVEMEDYLKSLSGDHLKKLIAAITLPIKKKEDTEDKIFYEQRQCIQEFVRGAFEESTLQKRDIMKMWVDHSFNLYLDYLHLDKKSLDMVDTEANDRFNEISDVWENFSDEKTILSWIEKITAAAKKPGFPKSKLAAETLSKPIEKLIRILSNPGDVQKYSGAFFDLMEALSQCEGDFELIQDAFQWVFNFFDNQSTDEAGDLYFKVVAPRFISLVEKLDIKFLKKTSFCSIFTNTLEKCFQRNKKSLLADWVAMSIPLIKRPCIKCFWAAKNIVGSEAIRWKDYKTVANELIELFSKVPIPTQMDENSEEYIKTFFSCVRYVLEGLKKARIIKEFGERLMSFNISLLEKNIKSTELYNLIEEIGEHIQLDIKGNKDKIMGVMKRLCVILKDEDLPWTTRHLQRAIEDTINSIIRPINDGRNFTDEDVKVFILMCHVCLSKDALNPDNGYRSSHFEIARAILNKLMSWLANTKRLGYAVKLIPLLLNKYDDQDEDVSSISSHFLNEFATGEPATMAPYLEQLIKMYLDQDNVSLLSPINITYPMNPAAMKESFQTMLTQLIDSAEPDIMRWMTQIFCSASKKQPELFTEKNMHDIIQRARDDKTNQAMLIQIMQEVSKREPKTMVKHIDLLMDETGWDSNLLLWLNEILVALALYDKKIANKVLDYLINRVKTNSDQTVLLIALNSIRLIGFKYQDIIKPKRTNIENLQFAHPDSQAQKKVIIDMIDGKTPDDLRKQMEEQQGALGNLVGKVEDVEEAVTAVRDDLDLQGQELNNVKNDVKEQGQRLDQVEETVEETVAKVEEIDSKTLSHAPYWSRDISKHLNPPTEHDWRLLSSRLGYDNADIRGWAQQADPCMAMLNEWYATRKTSQATYAILNNLQEMNRMDAALIVENAMKRAEAVVEDEEFEYASPPEIFLSYQWGHQDEVKLLHRHLSMAGYDCWMDIGQMGGGDKLFEKIDSGMRAAKLVISCVTSKYAKSPNCNREVNLAVGVKKTIIPLLLESCPWPPPGSMGPLFSESLYIQFFQTGDEQTEDERYWPVEKFQELLMQLSVNGLTPNQDNIEPMYRDWWMPLQEEIKIDKSKTRDGGKKVESKQRESDDVPVENPDVFISYQWGKQKNIIKLYQQLTSLGYSCWLDIKQMGGGDALYDKIDRGIRGCKVVLSCVTKKYALSANCRREVSLTDALKKPMLPLLLDEMTWPPSGPMSMIMTQLLYIDFHEESAQIKWDGPQFEELIRKINTHLPKSVAGAPTSTAKQNPKTTQTKKSNHSEKKPEHSKPKKVNKPEEEKPKPVEEPKLPPAEATTSSPHDNGKKDNPPVDTQKPKNISKPQSSNNSPSPSEKPKGSKSCSVL